MAYPHTKYERQFTTTAGAYTLSATASGELARMHVLSRPHKVRGFYISPTTTGDSADFMATAVWSLRARNANATTLATITTLNGAGGNATVTTGVDHGQVLYKEGLDTTISPGQALVLNVDTAATGAGAQFVAGVYLEPVWEQPTNDTNMILTT